MSALLSFVRSKKNRDLLSWLGGGAVVVIGGLWAAFVYFQSPKSDEVKMHVNANNGGVAIGGNVSNSPINAGSPEQSKGK